VVDGDPRRRRRRCGEITHPVSMTDGLRSNSVLEEEAMMASHSPSLVNDGSSSVVAHHSKQSVGGWAEVKSQHCHEERRSGAGFLWPCPCLG
jgi:hypothetical protein